MLMNLAISSLPYKGSGKISFLSRLFFLALLFPTLFYCFGFFAPYLNDLYDGHQHRLYPGFRERCGNAHLASLLHDHRDHHHGVLLQVVAFTADIGSDFKFVGQTYTSNLTQSRVWLFWVVVYTHGYKHRALMGIGPAPEPWI